MSNKIHVSFSFKINRGEIYKLHLTKHKVKEFVGDELIYYGSFKSKKKYIVVANPDTCFDKKVWFTDDVEKFITDKFINNCECGFLHKFTKNAEDIVCPKFYTDIISEGFHIINADEPYPTNVYESDWECKDDCIVCIYYAKNIFL